MDTENVTSGRGLRTASYLTIGFWILCYGLCMLPNLALYGELRGHDFAMFAVGNLFGLPASAAIFILTQGSRHLGASRRIALVVFSVVLLSVLHAFIEKSVIDAFQKAFAPSHYNPKHFRLGVVVEFLMYIWIYGMYAAGLASYLSALTVQERERQLAEARAAAQSAQLAALRFQLNPHFLFNTLNAISSLIVTGRPESADVVTTKLSDFLRASLSSSGDGLISLGEELDTLHAYLDIESVRFGDRMSTRIDCPADLLDCLVPSLMLQPLVENAVKFAVAPTAGPVNVSVRVRRDADDLSITVEDEGGVHAGQVMAGTGVGLQNVRSRLLIHYGAAGRLETSVLDSGFRAVVRYPLDPMATGARAGSAA